MLKSQLKLAIGATAFPSLGGFIMGIYYRPHNSDWYRDLKKPEWSPPNYVFGPTWLTLYCGMGYASYMVWRDGGGFSGDAAFALRAYGLQLLLNWAWSPIFFGSHSPKLALLDLSALFVTVGVTAVSFFKINVVSGLLMVPYLAWLGLAGALNISIIYLN